MDASTNTPRIFVSHSSKDNAFGQQLTADLRSTFGYDAVWYDASGYLSPDNGLRGGDKWWPLIVSEITKRDTFIIILSPDAVRPPDVGDSNVDGWVMDEFDIALALQKKIGKRIIPVLHRYCEPRADLHLLQWVDFTSRSYEQALNELLISIPPTPPGQEEQPKAPTQFAGQIAQPTPVPDTPSLPLDEGTEQVIRDIHAAFGMGAWKEVTERSNLLVRDTPGAMSFALWRECGLAYVERGDGNEALTALDHALDLQKHDVFALRGKGLALRLVGRGQEASEIQKEAYTRAAFDDVPLRLTLLDELVQTLRQLSQWDEALQRIDQALRLTLPRSPDQHDWMRIKLDTFEEAGRESDAFALARSLAPERSELIGHWAQQRFDSYQQTAKWPSALEAVDIALATELDNSTWLRRKLDVLVRMGQEARQARALAREIASSFPNVVDEWLQQRFEYYRQAENWDEALAVIAVALEIRRDDPVWLRARLDMLTQAEREPEARQLAAQWAQTHGDLVTRWLQQRFEYYRQAGNWDEALAVIALALEIRRDDPVWLRAKLDILTLAGRELEAREQALQWAKSYPIVVNNWLQERFQAYWDDKNWTAAQEIIHLGVRTKVDDARWYTHQKDVLVKIKKKRKALVVARKLTELPNANPDVWLAVVELASALHKVHEVRVAFAEYKAHVSDAHKVDEVSKQYVEPVEKASRRNWTLLFILASVIVLACVSIAALNVTGSGSDIGNGHGSLLANPLMAASMFVWLLAFVSGVVLTIWALVRTVGSGQSGWTVRLIALGLLLSWALPFLGPFLYFMYGLGTERPRPLVTAPVTPGQRNIVQRPEPHLTRKPPLSPSGISTPPPRGLSGQNRSDKAFRGHQVRGFDKHAGQRSEPIELPPPPSVVPPNPIAPNPPVSMPQASAIIQLREGSTNLRNVSGQAVEPPKSTGTQEPKSAPKTANGGQLVRPTDSDDFSF